MIQMYMAEKYFLGRYNYEVENLMKLEKEVKKFQLVVTSISRRTYQVLFILD